MIQTVTGPLIYLISGLLVLGGMPSFEVRHAHAGGSAPHGHHQVKSTQPTKSDHHQHPHHHHSDGHLHPAGEGHGTSDRSPTPESREQNESHTHFSWIGWLVGDTFSHSPEFGNASLDDQNALMATSTPGISELSRSILVISLSTYFHGPPPWIPIQALTKSCSFNRSHCLAAPLCDIARHERSGVQLI